jgi:uncharacterized protein (TIGR04255 family)
MEPQRPPKLTWQCVVPASCNCAASKCAEVKIDLQAMSRKPDLASYRRPPVAEVVCGVQFEPLVGFESVHFGRFWEYVKDEYPRTQDREPIAEIFEGAQGPQEREEVVTLTLPPLRRVFYMTEDASYLLQVQPSRFLANWKREREADEYPRFTAAYERFTRGWAKFLRFVADEKLGMPRANQYELTYINHVFETTQPFPEAIQEYLGFFKWREARTVNFLPPPRTATFRAQFQLPDGKGALHVSVNHGTRRTDQKGALVLELTARGPARSDWSDMPNWFDAAHEWIVTGFTDLTTSEAHRVWERER